MNDDDVLKVELTQEQNRELIADLLKEIKHLEDINHKLVQQVQELVQEVELTKADFGGDMR